MLQVRAYVNKAWEWNYKKPKQISFYWITRMNRTALKAHLRLPLCNVSLQGDEWEKIVVVRANKRNPSGMREKRRREFPKCIVLFTVWGACRRHWQVTAWHLCMRLWRAFGAYCDLMKGKMCSFCRAQWRMLLRTKRLAEWSECRTPARFPLRTCECLHS